MSKKMKKIILISGILVFLSGCVEQNINQRDISTNLVTASAEGDLDAFHDLIQKGADINKADEEGCTPLLGAVMNGQSRIAKELILKGADVNKNDKSGSTPLLSAAVRSDGEILELLLQYGADINKNTPLVLVAAEGNYYVAEALITHGANINAIDKEGGTALMAALFNDHEKIAKLLIEKGACVNKFGKDGSGNSVNPLITATIHGMYDVVKLLLECPFSINSTTFARKFSSYTDTFLIFTPTIYIFII